MVLAALGYGWVAADSVAMTCFRSAGPTELNGRL